MEDPRGQLAQGLGISVRLSPTVPPTTAHTCEVMIGLHMRKHIAD